MIWKLEYSTADGKMEEEYDDKEIRTEKQAIEKGKEYIDFFNSTLRPQEKVRTFVSAKLVGKSLPRVCPGCCNAEIDKKLAKAGELCDACLDEILDEC